MSPVAAWFGPRMMRLLHGLLGFYLCLALGFLCLFGTLTSIGHELDWLADPALRVVPGKRVASWGEMEAAIHTAYPGWHIQRISAPQGPRFAAEARMLTPQGAPRLLYINPYRSTVTRDRDRATIHATLRQIHRQFYLPNIGGINIGVYLATPFGLALALLLVSGLVMQPRFWQGLFRLRLRQGSGILLNDLHRLIAGWSLWFLAVIALTATWYFAERALLDGGFRFEPPPPRAASAHAPALPLDDLVARANAAWPDLQITAVYPPRRAGEALRMEGQAGDLLVRDRANKIWLDPSSGAVLRVDQIAEQGLLYRWNETANPLHFGDFAGTASRLLWFAFGCGLTALIFTGAWMYWRRLCQQHDLARRRAARAGQVRG